VDNNNGVANVFPVPKLNPPDDAAYQLIVPAEEVAARVTEPLTQTPAGVVPVMVGTGLIVATTAVLLAVVQPLKVAST
jgi:hypothetical protein